MQDTTNLNDVLTNAIDDYKEKCGKHQLASVQFSAGPATLGKLREGAYTFVNCQRNAAGGLSVTMLLGVIADVCKVAGSRLRPADAL
jgi:hypothetical protein